MKRFVSLTQTGEQTAIYCLSQHDWKLELASDAYFQNPEIYWRESMSKVTASADRKKIDQLFNKYRGNATLLRVAIFLNVLQLLLFSCMSVFSI